LSQVILRKSSPPTPILPAVIAKFRQFIADESGATAIEYGLIAAGISVAIIAVVNGLGTQLKATFSKVTSSLAAQ
jgi:pilus assembly protein Flp/PilA